DGSDAFLRNWVGIGLEYFHRLSRTVTRRLPDNAIAIDADGYRVSVGGQEYWLPTWKSLSGISAVVDRRAKGS
ncbi:hypothetical protein ACOICT_29445, partial [Klebsiella pneumoniae]